METIPETLAPQLVGNEAVQPGYEGGQREEGDEEAFILRIGPLQPGRYHRHDKIQTDQRVHEPQVPRH